MSSEYTEYAERLPEIRRSVDLWRLEDKSAALAVRLIFSLKQFMTEVVFN